MAQILQCFTLCHRSTVHIMIQVLFPFMGLALHPSPCSASALPPSWTWWGLGFVWASGAALRGRHMSRLVLGFVSCSCFHVFYFVIWFMLLVSCFPCPRVFLPCVCVMLWLVVLVMCLVPHWFLPCHVVLSSVCSLVGSCHVNLSVCYK